ncbi:MAG TPA: nitroreductase family protein [Acidimicrobiales bacterium]|jgi:nitroreductase|nr:nitroreductase family protein [Acidimicrobiales bacterium]
MPTPPGGSVATENHLFEIDHLLSTTRAVRRRLDLNRLVSREVVTECIRLACYAPNASNAQDWRWVVVDDPDQRALIGAHYRALVEPPVSQMLATKVSLGDEAGARISRSILYLAEHMAEVPVLVIPCYDVVAAESRYQQLISDPVLQQAAVSDTHEMTSGMYASILPAVWSFQLALRSRGLGSVLTTAHQADQPGMAEILNIPLSWAQTSLIPVAYTTGGDFNPPPRKPVEDVIVWNRRTS